MQNNQMINLAIMGIGTIGKRHLMAIDTIDNVKLCGIVDLTEDARSFCNYNKISIFDDLNELKKFTKVGISVLKLIVFGFRNDSDELYLL